MASNPPAQCCTIGVKHEGEASGKLEMIAGTETYVARPKDTTDRAILILTDVAGHKAINAQLIADQFAANGYLTVMPDLFHGDPVPMNRQGGDFDFMKWISKHGTDQVDPLIDAAIKYLRNDMGIKKIGAAGYCFGAKGVARFLKPGAIDAGFVAHPSFVDADEIKGMQGPFSIAAAETDSIFPTEKRRETEDLLLKMDIPWQINLYSDVEHGFSVRGDLSNPKIKWAKEQAFYQAVQWFDEYIKKE